MVTQSERRSRGFLKPVVGGLLLIAALVAGIYFRTQVWDFFQWLGRTINKWATEWVPDHPGQTVAIVGFTIVAFVINWIAHVRGRLRAWIFALVVQLGLWFLFWYRAGIPSLNELFGLNVERMSSSVVILSGLIVTGVTGAIFWFMEAREEWRKYRRRHHVDED